MSLPTEPASDLTTLLHAWRDGNDAAFGQLIDQVYEELKRIAARRLGQSSSATLMPTDLLHEALIGIMPTDMDFKNRAHFFATMSLAIRSILVDHARARGAHKRGGDMLRVTFTNVDVGEESQAMDLLAMDEALNQLEKMDPRCAQVMHLTYFAGLSRDDICALLNVTVRTVTRDLVFGRAWVMKAFANDT